jgi:hypothetical protein
LAIENAVSGRLEPVRWTELAAPDRRAQRAHHRRPRRDPLFYVHGVPPGGERGGHAHRVTEHFVIALAGGFSLDLSDASGTRSFRLEAPDRGVYVLPMLWDRLYDFSPGAVCLVVVSTRYAESDYIRDWSTFARESAALGP